jgi:hypothetical protein
VLLEGGPQLVGIRGFRHLGQGIVDLLFRVLNVLER